MNSLKFDGKAWASGGERASLAHDVAIFVAVALAWMAAADTARGQSSWPSYPNNTAISVTSAGNVGIGTSSAVRNLEIDSSSTAGPGIRLVSTASTVPANMGIWAWIAEPTGGFVIHNDTTAAQTFGFLVTPSNPAGSFLFSGANLALSSSSSTDFSISNNSTAGGTQVATSTFDLPHSGGATAITQYAQISANNGLSSTSGNETGQLDFFAMNAGNWGSRLTIAGGYVGIGTQTPGSRLDVQNGQVNSSGGFCISQASCITSWSQAGVGGTVTSVAAGAGLTGGPITTSGTISLDLTRANTWSGAQTFGAGASFPGNGIWNASGWLGVGTTAPRGSLDVNGEIVAVNRLTLAQDLGTATNTWHVDNSSGLFRLFWQPNINAPGAVVMAATTSGKVGIGTITPSHTLHVAGTIGAEEVIVSSDGADYVFDKGYRLAPLSEVAAYIGEHHHLPGVPSADEMKEKGVGVSEMQAKLLAKVEELTLHQIELERENREMREKIARLEAGQR